MGMLPLTLEIWLRLGKKRARVLHSPALCSNAWWRCVFVVFFVEHAADGDDDDGVAELVPDDDYGQSGAAADGLLFRCRICWKGFKHPMSLTLHKDLHTGQTRCPICQRIFSRSYDMKAHLLRIHKRQHTFSVFDVQSNFQKWWLSFLPRLLFRVLPPVFLWWFYAKLIVTRNISREDSLKRFVFI